MTEECIPAFKLWIYFENKFKSDKTNESLRVAKQLIDILQEWNPLTTKIVILKIKNGTFIRQLHPHIPCLTSLNDYKYFLYKCFWKGNWNFIFATKG